MTTLRAWDDVPYDADSCVSDYNEWNDMVDYIRHGKCLPVTFYGTCSKTDPEWVFEERTLTIEGARHLYVGNFTDMSLYLGRNAGLLDDHSEYYNVGIGFNSLGNNDSPCNVAVGGKALELDNSGAGWNVAIGYSSLYNNTTGHQNVAVGGQSGLGITTGVDNVIVGGNAQNNNNISNGTILGFRAGYNNANGGVVLIGRNSGYENSGDRAILIGESAGYNNTTSYTIGIGYEALKNNTGTYNTAIGTRAGVDLTSGVSNSMFGAYSGENITTGDYNIFIGGGSGGRVTTGDKNTCIGHDAGYGLLDDATGSVMIGHKTGYNSADSNRLYINNKNSAYPLIYGEFDNDVVKFGDNDSDWFAQFKRNADGDMRWYGGDDTGDDLTIYANSTDSYPYMEFEGDGSATINTSDDMSYTFGSSIFIIDKSNAGSGITTMRIHAENNSNSKISLFEGVGVNYGSSINYDGNLNELQIIMHNNDVSGDKKLFVERNTKIVGFGEYTSDASATINGYITIKDINGNTRYLACVTPS